MPDAQIPVSQLNKLVFCPRRFYYEYVLGEWQDNAYTVTGTMRHERADTPGRESRTDKVTTRAVSVASERLGIVGRLDVLEESNGALLPVEYKSGGCSEHGPWHNDAIQLCALALCLEERTGQRIPKGALFTFGDRVRRDVVFTDALRAQTEAVIAEAHALAARPEIPAPVYSRRCEGCSLKPICLPQETAQMRKGNRGADDLQTLVTAALQESEIPPPKAATCRRCRAGRWERSDSRMSVLYVQEQGAYLKKRDERLIVELNRETVREIPLVNLEQVVCFGNVQVSSQTLSLLLEQNVELCFLTMHGKFRGRLVGEIARNGRLRQAQCRVASDPAAELALAARFVWANCGISGRC